MGFKLQSNLRYYFGAATSEVIYQNGSLNRMTTLFLKPDKKVWRGPVHVHNDYYNVSTYKKYYYGIMLLIPWNKITYPFIVFLIAFRESQNIKWFFKNIFEHCIWSLNIFKKLDLPNESLRKIVNIPNDASYELRKGR